MKNVLLPMLATRAVPFDSDQYLFEVTSRDAMPASARTAQRKASTSASVFFCFGALISARLIFRSSRLLRSSA
jgi:hypothetical protein